MSELFPPQIRLWHKQEVIEMEMHRARVILMPSSWSRIRARFNREVLSEKRLSISKQLRTLIGQSFGWVDVEE
jgi:hypothetical protein